MKSLCCYLFLLFSFSLFSKTIDLNDAIKEKLISIEVEGEGGNSGKSLKIRFLNQTKKNIEVRIPAGQLFHSEDSSLQDLIISKERILAMEGNQKRIGKFYGLCTQSSNSSPIAGSVFNMGALATGHLLKVAQYISKHNLQGDQGAQSAIWAVTDDHRLENIGNSELANYVAEVLGKSPPEYAILHQNRSIPGQPAFQENPVSLRGLFKYELKKDEFVSFGLYDEAGVLVHNFRENTKQIRGFHKFRFFFEISGLKKGKYSIRLVSKEGVIEKMDVEF